MKEVEGEVLIGKNTLFYRAFMKTVMADHREACTGTAALTFAYGDPVRVAKVTFHFMKEVDKDKPLCKIKGAYIQGRFLKPQEVQALAELPPKEVLVSRLMGAIRGRIYALVMALKSAPQKLVLTLKAIEEKKS
ncbi:MAG: 50S ribosomal protein L10 [Aquificaceae bacterium]